MPVSSSHSQIQAPLPKTAPQKAPSNEKLLFADIYEDQVKQFFEQYVSQIDTDLRSSFESDSEQIYRKSMFEQESALIKVQEDNQVEGIAFVSIDKTCYQQRRMIIHHISAVRREDFERIVKEVTDFIWKNDHCQVNSISERKQ